MAKKKNFKGPDKLSVHHDKHNNTVFVCFYDGCLSGTLTITPEQAIAIGEYGNMAKVYQGEMEKMAKQEAEVKE